MDEGAPDEAGGKGLLGSLVCRMIGAVVTVTAMPSWMVVVESFTPNGAGESARQQRAAREEARDRARTRTRTNTIEAIVSFGCFDLSSNPKVVHLLGWPVDLTVD